MAAGDEPKPPQGEVQKLLKVATHQAQNLETLKNDSAWLRGRVESIDVLLQRTLEELIEQERGVNRKLWHVVLWLYILIAMMAIGFISR